MKKSILIFLALILTSPLYSQEDKFTEIDNYVNEFFEMLEEDNPSRSMFVIANTEVHRGIGPVEVVKVIVYDIIDLPIELGLEPVEFGRTRHLKAYMERVMAGSYVMSFTWLYNENENLVYYNEENTADGCGEFICYFENENALRIVSRTLSDEEYSYEVPDQTECNYTRNAGEFTTEDLKIISDIQSRKVKQLNLLRTLSED